MLLLRCYSVHAEVVDLGLSSGFVELPEQGLSIGCHAADPRRLTTDQKVAGSIPAERTRKVQVKSHSAQWICSPTKAFLRKA